MLAFARGPLSRSLTWPLFGCASGSLLSIVSGHCIKPVVLNSCLPMRSASLRGPPRRGARRLAGPGFFQGSSQLAGSGGLRGPPFSPGRGRLAGSASFRAPLRIAHNTHTRTRARTHVHTRTRARALSHTHTHTRTHTHTDTRARAACARHVRHIDVPQGASRNLPLPLGVGTMVHPKPCNGAPFYTRMHACVSRHKAARGIRPDPGPLPHGLRARPIPFLARLHSVAWLCLRRVK